MSAEKIGRRYAQALYLAAQEGKARDAIMADTGLILETLQSSPDLYRTLTSPQLSSFQKQGVVTAVFKDGVSELTRSFLLFLGHKNRLTIIREIFTALSDIFREAAGLLDARVESARPFSPKEKDDLQKQLNRRTGKKVELEYSQGKKLLAGFKVQFPDLVLDCSVSHQLETLKALLISP
jgi:F-type H+-transporting ATPase subunit delta